MNSIEKKIPQTRWLRIIPILFFANVVCWIDKSVLSYAVPAGMAKDLGLSGSVVGLLGTVFSIGYLFLQMPGSSMAAKGKCKKPLALTMVGWSVVIFLLGSSTTATEALIYRFILGVFEGAVYPALVTLIANWFPNDERARATSMFLSSASISQIIMGPTVSMILLNNNWRTLFHFASVISVILVVLWLIFLSERPEDAKWLNEVEKNYLIEKFKADKANQKSGEKAPLLEVIKNINVWKISIMYFGLSMGTLGFAFWLPTLVKTITKTGMTQTGLLSAIPNIGVLIGVLSMGFISDKTQKRKLFAGICPMIFTGLLVVAMLCQSSPWLSFGIICVAGLFLQGAAPNMWAMVGQLLTPEEAGTARGFINSWSNVGGMVAPLMIGYITDITGNQILTWSVVFGFSVLSFLISLTLPKHLNGKMKRKSDVEDMNVEEELA